MSTVQTQPRNMTPANGSLAGAVLIMADRMSLAETAATVASLRGNGADCYRLQRVAARRSRALERLVFALARGGVR
jgi:hypothetical protein